MSSHAHIPSGMWRDLCLRFEAVRIRTVVCLMDCNGLYVVLHVVRTEATRLHCHKPIDRSLNICLLNNF